MGNEKIVKIDVRVIPLSERHPRKIFDIWDGLNAGETLQIINDHDPKPLYYQFEIDYKGCYKWEYIAQGPKDWIINIIKIKAK